VLVNGNQNEMTIETAGCESWSSGGSHVTMVETVNEGVVGAVQEVAEVVSLGTSAMSGGFYLSTDFEGDMNVPQVNVSVQQESRIVTTGSDLRGILYPGDYARIGTEVFRVHATATHSGTQIILDREYPHADNDLVTLYTMDTVACHSTAIDTSDHVTVTADGCGSHFEAGDSFAINGKKYKVASVSSSQIVSTTAISYVGQNYTIYKRKRASMAFNEGAISMKSKLEALPGIGSVDVVRTGPDNNNGYVWTITFTSVLGASTCSISSNVDTCLMAESDRAALSLAHGAATVTITQAGVEPTFVNGTSKTIDDTVFEVQEIKVKATGGTFALGFDGATSEEKQPTMRYDVTAHDMKFKLEELSSIGIVSVSRTTDTVTTTIDSTAYTTTEGYTWRVTFLTNLGNLPLLTYTTALSGTNWAITVTEKTMGVAPTKKYHVPQLATGNQYHVRIASGNEFGFGPYTTTTIRNGGQNADGFLDFPCTTEPCPLAPQRIGGVVPLILPVRQAPGAPALHRTNPLTDSVKKTTPVPYSASQLYTSWDAADTKGSPIEKYKVEWYKNKGTEEVQSIALTNTASNTAGTFTVSYGAETSPRIAHDATETEVKLAIEEMKAITQVTTTRVANSNNGYTWSVTFVQDLGDIAELVPDYSRLEGANPVVTVAQEVQGTNYEDYGMQELDTSTKCSSYVDHTPVGPCAAGNREVQVIVNEAASTLAGTFRLSYRGETTPEQAWDASASSIESALNGLSTVNQVDVSRSVTLNNGYRWYVTFQASDGPVDKIVPNGEYLDGENAVINNYEAVVITTDVDREHNITGNFKIALGSQISNSLAYDVTETVMHDELILMTNIGRVDVSRVRHKGKIDRWVWTILFRAYDGDLNTLQVIPDADFLGKGAQIHVRRPRGVKALSHIIGNHDEIQTITLRHTGSDVTNGTFKLQIGADTTSCITWGTDAHGTAGAMKESLEALSTVDRVTVTRSSDTPNKYTYVYTVHFWGEVTGDMNIPEITVPSGSFADGANCYAFEGGANHEVLIHTSRDATALANHDHRYIALQRNTEYHVRVSAKNAEGYGYASIADLVTTPEISVVPSRPQSFSIGDQYSGSTVEVQYSSPVVGGGKEISKYKIEWDTDATFTSANLKQQYHTIVDEVQTVTTSFNDVTNRGGTFTLSWRGLKTIPLNWNETPENVALALQIITGAYIEGKNPVYATRTDFLNGHQWSVTFLGLNGNIGILEADDSELRGYNPKVVVKEVASGNSDIVPGAYTYEEQSITTSADTSIGGNFVLQFEGDDTATIAYDEAESSFKTKLEALTTIHTVNVVKKYTSGTDDTLGVTWIVRFTHLLHERMQGAGNVQLFTVSTNTLTGVQASIYVKEIYRGTNPFYSEVTGLSPGVQYYFRAFAFNGAGFSGPSDVISFTPREQPASPTSAVLHVASGTSLTVSFMSPAYTGGAAISAFKVEYYSQAPTLEVQAISTSSEAGVVEIQKVETIADTNNINNFFKLTFMGETTHDLRHDITALNLQAALIRLSTIGTIDVVSDRSGLGYSKITSTGTVSVGSGEAFLTCDDTCTFTSEYSRGDRIWVVGQSFTISSNSTLPFNDTYAPLASPVDAGVDATSAVSATGIKAFKWANGYEWTITYVSHVGDQPPIVATPSTGWSGTKVTLNVFTMRNGLQPIAGSFTLALRGDNGFLSPVVPTTKPIPFNASAAVVRHELQTLTTVGSVSVMRTRNGFGYTWRVTFLTNLGDQHNIIASPAQLTGPSANIGVTELVKGAVAADYKAVKLIDMATMPLVQYSITNLTQGTAYMVRVAAMNSEGYGAVSLTTPAGEIPRTVPSQIASIIGTSMSKSVIKVTWSPPSDGIASGGATIDHYKIEWDTEGDFKNIATSGYTHIFTDLSAGSGHGPFYYNIPVPVQAALYMRVSAHNNMGYGPTYATASVYPNDQKPAAPHTVALKVVSDAELEVTWVAPRMDTTVYGGDGGRPITKYLIEWDKDFASGPQPESATVDGNSLKYVIGARNPLTGERSNTLEAGVTYYVRVSAYNNLGYGPSKVSSPDSAAPAAQVPEVPTSMSIATASGTSLQATWGIPLSDGGSTFTKSHVEWDSIDTFNSRNIITVNASSSLQQGSYALSFGTASSTCIEWNAVASGSVSSFETIVEGIAGLTDVTVTRSGDASSNYQYGYTYTIAFVNPVAPNTALTLAVDQSACTQFRLIAGNQDVATETAVTVARGPTGTHTIDFVPEVQVVSTYSDLKNEIQSIRGTVDVTNERQRIKIDLPTKQDEIQTIKTSSSVATAEVQKIVTTTDDVNEVQHITLSAQDIDEVQSIRTFGTHIDDVQRIRITATDSNEIQYLEITEKRHTQRISFAGMTKDSNNYTISGGQFRLTYFTETARTYSPCLDYTISQTNLDTAIETLTGIGDVAVSTTGSLATNDKEFSVTFPAVSTPFALSIDKPASYPEFGRGDNPGRDNNIACVRANTLAGEFITIDCLGPNEACTDVDLPLIGSYGDHNLNDGDYIMISYKTAASSKIALHNHMFSVGVVNNTHFTISANFSETDLSISNFGSRVTLGPLNGALANERGNWIRVFQPTIITSISRGRDSANSPNFEEQIVTTSAPHGFSSGDLIQLSLHWQVADTAGYNFFNPTPQGATWRMKSLYRGMMHSNVFEVDKKN
jgi:uncharacterized protein YpmB